MFKLPADQAIQTQIEAALEEDVGSGDVSAALIPDTTDADAVIVCREAAVICGCIWAQKTFKQIDKTIEVRWQINDGDSVCADTMIASLHGPAAHILTAERTALNFLQTLSGTATLTHQYVQAIEGTAAKLLDTRKTLPGLRNAQKYAVQCGGGYNHRQGLYDAFLIKENHIHAAGGIAKAIMTARRHQPELMLEVEVENIQQLQTALQAGPDRVLLDNFTLAQLTEAVDLTAGKTELEASGNITLDNIYPIAASGIDFISIGALTKNVRAVDLSLLFQ